MLRRNRFFFICVLPILVIGTLLALNGCSQKEEGGQAAEPSSFRVIDEAYELIRSKGVYPVEGDKLVEGALRGMADVIGDPYSTYLSKEEAAAHRESLANERIGIGAEITRTNGRFIIVSPIKASPAEKAGLRPYDEIVRIDGERLEGQSLREIVKRIRGKKGTSVKMTIYRPETDKHIEISVVREAIPVKTVEGHMIDERKEKIGYISITTFGEDTAKEWEKVTTRLLQDGAKGLIIDVRGNPGGYLHSVGEIAGSLLQNDTVFAYMQDADGSLTPLVTEPSAKLTFDEKLKIVPVVLMQNEGSASASEVLSGALKDLNRGFIAGTTSFGKGTVQETMDLANGGEMKLSTHKWLTPKEQWIHGTGVEAELEVEQGELFSEHIRMVADIYTEGDYHDDIAYGQRILEGLGYNISRTDGYFDKITTRAVRDFKKESGLEGDNKMDRHFYSALREKMEDYRNDSKNDSQLQMAIGYMHHKISGN